MVATNLHHHSAAERSDRTVSDTGEGQEQKPKASRFPNDFNGIGGEGGIRTHDGLAPTPVFKTGALNRSATSPGSPVYRSQTGLGRAEHILGRIVFSLEDQGDAIFGFVRAGPCRTISMLAVPPRGGFIEVTLVSQSPAVFRLSCLTSKSTGNSVP